MTPRRYVAISRVERATYARRNAEKEWRDAIREMHAAGFSLREIADMTGVVDSRVAALLRSEWVPRLMRDTAVRPVADRGGSDRIPKG